MLFYLKYCYPLLTVITCILSKAKSGNYMLATYYLLIVALICNNIMYMSYHVTLSSLYNPIEYFKCKGFKRHIFDKLILNVHQIYDLCNNGLTLKFYLPLITLSPIDLINETNWVKENKENGTLKLLLKREINIILNVILVCGILLFLFINM